MPPVIKPRPPLADLTPAHQALMDLRAAAAELPEDYRAIFAELLRATANELSPPQPEVPEDDTPAIDRLAQFFKARNNEPASLADMAAGTDLAYSTIRVFVYTRHRDKFKQLVKPVRGGKGGHVKFARWQWAGPLEEDTAEDIQL